ncbi:unnamed protein product [Lactuca virosa]|uniref:Pentatricopeptide repeat-containing protein n=1 Tax=Lactuca virosa TaxID=75947 RepID=A0AAU9MIE5_9ASTR|nr:unnamed protein product [Lactuca virosa]
METYSKVKRFLFICKLISRIIELLGSRCAKFRFKPLLEENMSTRVLHICNEEGLNLDLEALSLLILSCISQGDLRGAIILLQEMCLLSEGTMETNILVQHTRSRGIVKSDKMKAS